MKKNCIAKTLFSHFFFFLICIAVFGQKQVAPAYPLITHNSYFSIWSMTDDLNASTTKHWTGADQSLIGIIKVDKNYYRFLGKPKVHYRSILPTYDEVDYSIKYTEAKPLENWNLTDFDASAWKIGKAAFGKDRTGVKSEWNSENIWLRREFEVNEITTNDLLLKIDHDDDVEVFLNGVEIFSEKGATGKFKFIPLNEKFKKNLKKGKNVLAIHCLNTGGAAFIDAGIVETLPSASQEGIQKAVQENVQVRATQTIYNFRCGPLNLEVKFISPLLLQDLELLSRPVSYINFQVKATDNKSHDVQIYFGASSDISVNLASQEVQADVIKTKELSILKTGTTIQPILKKKGDDLRIDWGYFYVAAPNAPANEQFISKSEEDGIASFLGRRETAKQRLSGKSLMLNTIINVGSISKVATENFIELAYDEIEAVQFFYRNLKPWWNKNGNKTIQQLLASAYEDHNPVLKKSNDFDGQLYSMARNSGGEEYAHLCEVAYRQSIAAHVLVNSPQAGLLFLSKENFSNGSINTVDVTYPSSPLYLLYNPELLKGMLNGIFYYSESGKWQKPFPAHDLGTYPLANGQTYGEDMPVEEAGNMVILTAAIAKAEGNAHYAQKHWEQLTRWVQFLSKEGLDPANQLCTDDFAGHLARNANLSVKAIVAIGSYAMTARMLGKNDIALKYSVMAKKMAKEWVALAGAGDHYALTFNDKNTWSQKYNLVWDKVLDLGIFADSISTKELAFYRTRQNEFGLPLDHRKNYSKSDWIIWTATLSSSKEQFEEFVKPVYRFVTKTPVRIPLSDWYGTIDALPVGFRARSVVGGFFMKVLSDKFDNKENVKTNSLPAK